MWKRKRKLKPRKKLVQREKPIKIIHGWDPSILTSRTVFMLREQFAASGPVYYWRPNVDYTAIGNSWRVTRSVIQARGLIGTFDPNQPKVSASIDRNDEGLQRGGGSGA